MDDQAAARLLQKLRVLVEEHLDDDERALFAALLAPGVARAHAEDDVVGFGVTGWSPSSLPESLVEALRRQGNPAESQ